MAFNYEEINVINTQGEHLYILKAKEGNFKGKPILILHDDFPSDIKAYHLFDEETALYFLISIEEYYPTLLERTTFIIPKK